MGNPWDDFSLVGMGLRSINPVGLYPLSFLVGVEKKNLRIKWL
jgi:hypothetical protein